MDQSYTTIDHLKGQSNYELWKFQIQVLLEANGSFGVVSGSSKKPEPTEKDLFAEWIKKDSCGKKMLILTIDKGLQTHIMNCKSSNEMWSKIREMYEKKGDVQKNKLLQEFYSATYEKGSSLLNHLSKIESIYHKLKEVDNTVTERMVVNKILSTLPARLNTFKTIWEMNPQLEQTLSNLTSRLMTEDERSRPNNSGAEVSFMAHENKNKRGGNHYKKPFRNNNRQQITCFVCNEKGHKSFECPQKKESNKSDNKGDNEEFSCTICRHPSNNHTDEMCFFRKKKGNFKNKNKNEKKVCFLTSDVNKTNFGDWIVDSGSSKHMTNNASLLVNLEENLSEIGLAKENTFITAKSAGTLVSKKCDLTNVLYVPELSRNLISVDAIVKKGGEVKFDKSGVTITKSGAEILKGERNEDGVFTIKLNKNNTDSAFLASKVENAYEWHEKLGHLSCNNIKKLIKISDGLNVNEKELLAITDKCEICIKSKQVRNSFGDERTAASRPLEIIHSDLCGFIQPETWDGKSYFATFKDDYTGFTQIYLLAYKSELFDALREYVAEAESKWPNMKVHKLRTDRGGEYSSNQLIAWCKEKGIVRDLAPARTPQLNGTSERENRTLCEKARALLMTSGLDKSFWGEAMYVATYLANRSPHKNLEKTPYENWHGKKPNLKNLQVFGDRAFVKKLGHLKKLDNRSEELVFVGYAPNCYRLWDKNSRKIVLSRDVIFKRQHEKPTKLNGVIFREDVVQNDEEDEKKNENEIRRNADGSDGEQGDEEEEEELDISLQASEDSLFDFFNESGNETIREDSEYQPSSDIDSQSEQSAGDRTLEHEDGRRYPERERQPTKRFPDEQLYLTHIPEEGEPATYTEAIRSEHSDKWKSAMVRELNSLHENKTWRLVDRPKNRNVVKSKWVFKIKKDENNKIEKFKARVVARGFSQKYGEDFDQTFSPVVRHSTIRFLIALAAQLNLKIDHFDVETAFLNAELSEEIFMEQPEGGIKKGQEDKVCYLLRSIYGLKQASRQWYELADGTLIKLGYKKSILEVCVYYKIEKGSITIIALYVDDFLIFWNQISERDYLRDELLKIFKIKDLGRAKHCLGITIEQDERRGEIRLNQKKYILNLLEKFKMTDCNPAITPLEVGCVKTDFENKNNQEIVNVPYQNLIGGLMYLVVSTRPDIAFSVSYLSQFNKCPTEQNWKSAKRILRYLKGTIDKSIVYKCSKNGIELIGYEKGRLLDANNIEILGFSDADYANDPVDRKSYGGFVYFLSEGPISWESRKQRTIAQSSCESEYMALAEASKEACFFKNFYSELFNNKELKITLHCDNLGAIDLAQNPGYHKRSKHIEVRYHFVREKLKDKKFDLKHVCTQKMIADVLTKPLPKPAHDSHLNAMLK